MIHLFCALKCEAKSVIQAFNLQKNRHSKNFTVYNDNNGDISLTITGIGKLSMATAVTHTRSLMKASCRDGYLNFGIAGHRSFETGSAKLINKIVDGDSGKTWYPQIVFDTSLDTAMIITVDKPVSEYPGDALYDMESSGFYDCISRFSIAEMAHCLKIVSDNLLFSPEKITGTYVNDLISENIGNIGHIISRLSAISDELPPAEITGEMYDSFTARWHFTWTERVILKQLLNHWKILLPGVSPLSSIPGNRHKGKEILIHLRKTLDACPVSYNKDGGSV